MTIPTSQFLPSGARLGTWWVPDELDANEEGCLDPLPTRRVPGILTFQTSGDWSLLLSHALPSDSPLISGPWSIEVRRQDRIWGITTGSTFSLFNGTLTNSGGNFSSHIDQTWSGSWCAESTGVRVTETDPIERLHLTFDAAGTWSEKPPGDGRQFNLFEHWNRDTDSFTVPPALVYHANIDEAQVRLCRDCRWTLSADRLEVEVSTDFEIEDTVELGMVSNRWIRPLYDLLSFFWLRDPGLQRIRVRLPNHRSFVELRYGQPLAQAADHSPSTNTESLAPFATLEGIIAKGYSFQDLLSGYWKCRERGIGGPIELLNESQYSLLDQSIDAQLLNATKSLEAYEESLCPDNNSANLNKAIGRLLQNTGTVGQEILDIWHIRAKDQFANSIPRIRNMFVAHGQMAGQTSKRTDSQLVDQDCHVIALQWLLRRRYLEEIGFDSNTADQLVIECRGYKGACEAMRAHYHDPENGSE